MQISIPPSGGVGVDVGIGKYISGRMQRFDEYTNYQLTLEKIYNSINEIENKLRMNI